MTDFRKSIYKNSINQVKLTYTRELVEGLKRMDYMRNTISESNEDLTTMILSTKNLLEKLNDKVVIKIGGKNGQGEISQKKYEDDEYLKAIIDDLCRVFNTEKENLCLVFDGDNNERKSGYSQVLNWALSNEVLVVAVKKDNLKLTGPFMEDWGVIDRLGSRTPPERRSVDVIDHSNFYLINIPASNSLSKETLTLMVDGTLFLDMGHLVDNYFNFNTGKMRQGGSEIFRLLSKLKYTDSYSNKTFNPSNFTLDESKKLLNPGQSKILINLKKLQTEHLALFEESEEQNEVKRYYESIEKPNNRHLICIDQRNARITSILNN